MCRFDDYDQYAQDAMRSWNCPGLALAVVRGDELIHQGVYGLRDAESQLPMTVGTRFPMASCTKSFTAMSVALLVDDGKLDWDKPVREYMPEFILSDAYATEHVTVRDMLSHRTGMPRHDLSAFRLDVSRAEFVKRMRHLKFNCSFRERYQYNNLMYYVLPYLVEKLSGQKWEDFVRERIFVPLGMKASNFVPEPPEQGQVAAQGYRLEHHPDGSLKALINTPLEPYSELSPGGAGALFSTLADLTQWLKLHINGGRVDDLQIVSPDNLKQMHLPQSVVPGGGFNEALMGTTIALYGMGWFIEPFGGHTLIQHGGNLEGHSLMVGFVPDEKVGIIALTNVADMPLRDLLLYESIDRALDLPERDWNRKYHEMFDPLIVAQVKSKQTTAQEKVEGAPCSHPLDTFTGEYEADGYPAFAVRLSQDGLQARTVGCFDWSELRHYHYDIFEWNLVDFDEWLKVRFLTNDQGEIDSVSVPMEEAVDNILFTRKPPQLTEGITAAVLGEYQTAMDGVAYSVTAHDGKVYISETGDAPREVSLYKLSDDLVGFRRERVRFDFVREKDAILRLLLKGPDLTIEASRKRSAISDFAFQNYDGSSDADHDIQDD